jgi:hypothetical protein
MIFYAFEICAVLKTNVMFVCFLIFFYIFIPGISKAVGTKQAAFAFASKWFFIFVTVLPAPCAGQRTWFSDLLRAGRSGGRIPVGARFSEPVDASLGANPASCTMGFRVFPGGKAAGAYSHLSHLIMNIQTVVIVVQW